MKRNKERGERIKETESPDALLCSVRDLRREGRRIGRVEYWELRVKRVLGRDWSGVSSAPELEYNNNYSRYPLDLVTEGFEEGRCRFQRKNKGMNLISPV